ncbi:hypothetical protein [Streptomyces sp. NPDC127066]|uniref:hypothetical protein n=1 Tax=Streptomyces sp. NPDC127066 TaxID=3347125 RepID=UPI0036636C47
MTTAVLRRRRSSADVEPAASPAAEETRILRHYTLLRTTGPDGSPGQYTTTRPTGTVIVHQVNGHLRRFELTPVPLADGTFAAEPLD